MMRKLIPTNAEQIDHIIYGIGLNRRPTTNECEQFQHFIENKLVFKPMVWATVSFLKPMREDDGVRCIEWMMSRITRSVLRCHTLPIVGYNTIDGKIQSDIHITMLLNAEEYDGTKITATNDIIKWYRGQQNKFVKIIGRRDQKIMMPFGNHHIVSYNGGRCIQYTLQGHKRMTHLVYCPNRHRECRSRRRGNQCVYRRQPMRLLRLGE